MMTSIIPKPKPHDGKHTALWLLKVEDIRLLTPLIIFAGEGCCDLGRLLPRGASKPRHAWSDRINNHALSGAHSSLISSTLKKLTKKQSANHPVICNEQMTKYPPQSHPYLLALLCLQNLTREMLEAFFISTLILPPEERRKLVAVATDCFSKRDPRFTLDFMRIVEAGCIKNKKDRLMQKIKLGKEGWLEEGLQKGLQEGRQEERAEVARRMLEDGAEADFILRMTGLTRKQLAQLRKKRA